MAGKVMLALVVLALLGVALTLWRAGRNDAAALTAYPPEGRILTVDGHPVHVVQMGTGPDVVLIHGAAGNTRDMSFSLGPALAAHYRVTIIDRPGLGHTPPLTPHGDSIDAQAAFLARTTRALGIDRPIVVGQSYGGAVALAWALHEQPAALVLLAAASNPWDTPLPRLYQLTTHPVYGGVVRTLLAAWVSDDYVARSIEEVFAPQPAPAGYGDHIGAALTLRRSALRANGLQRAQLLPQIRAQVPRYASLTLPVELVHGDADTTVSLRIHSEPLAQQIPGAALTVLPGVGHMPHHVAEPEVIAAIHRAATRAGLR